MYCLSLPQFFLAEINLEYYGSKALGRVNNIINI